MSRVAAISQPSLFPPLDWWNRRQKADVVVSLDDANYDPSFPANRCTLWKGGPRPLTAPIYGEQHRLPINKIDLAHGWEKDLVPQLDSYYPSRPRDLPLYRGAPSLLWLVYASIAFCKGQLGIADQDVSSSLLKVKSAGNQRLIDLCHAVEADTLLLSRDRENDVAAEQPLFASAGITVWYHDWECPVENLSVLHYLLTDGAQKTKEHITSAATT